MQDVVFNRDWYGVQAKVLLQDSERVVVDYGCNGRGIVKNYNLFEGIQLCFLDFETDESMKAQKFNPGQKAMLNLRLGLLDSCLEGGNLYNRVSTYFKKGQLTIIE